jgi:hypothetical protein
MENTLTNVLPENGNTHKKEATKGFLQEHRNNLLRDDKWIIPRDLANELKELNAQMDEPLETVEVNKIVQETDFKRALVPPERTRAYLLDRGREADRDDLVMQDILLLINGLNRRNCEQILSEGELRQIATEVKEGTADEIEDEIGVIMADVQAEEVTWLWERRIPLGKLTILEGDPDKGKSVITMDLAARVTRGLAFPVEHLEHVEKLEHLEHVEPLEHLAGGVVVLNAEDGLADTIKPRLIAAGADNTRVRAVPAINPDDTLFSIPKDIPRLERAIRSVDARLVIIDPLSVFMKGDPHKDNEVRKALTPLADMAERLDVAVVVVRHFTKNVETKALYRGGGSIGIVGAARSALAVAPHPDDEEAYVLVPQKGNLAKKPSTLAYNIVEAENGAPRIQWGGAVNFQADEILNPDIHSKVDEARDWIRAVCVLSSV